MAERLELPAFVVERARSLLDDNTRQVCSLFCASNPPSVVGCRAAQSPLRYVGLDKLLLLLEHLELGHAMNKLAKERHRRNRWGKHLRLRRS